VARLHFRLGAVTLVLALALWLFFDAPRTALAATTLFPGPTASPLAATTSNCTQIGTVSATSLVAIIFETSSAQASGFNLQIYSATPCSVSNELYQTGQVGAGAVILLSLPFAAATNLYYTMPTVNGDGFRIIYS